MKEKGRVLCNRAASLALAVMLMVSAFVVAAPFQVSASERSFQGSGTSSVTISDAQCSFAQGGDPQWIRFMPQETGYISITAKKATVQEYSDGFITLCDASKQVLDATRDIYTTAYQGSKYSTVTYGVKKGVTYYFKVESAAGVTLKATVKAVKKNAGTSRAKAKTLKQNKKVNGVILAGDKKADWYKINVSQSKKVTLSFSVKTNGWEGNSQFATDGIQFSFYDANGKKVTPDASDVLTKIQNKGSAIYYSVDSDGGKKSKKAGLAPGTYYIKVERSNAASSGLYSLKWKMS